MGTNINVKKKGPDRYNSLDVTALVEISNISINGNLNDDCRVYGDITVEDEGHIFSIYHRTEKDPQLMVSDNELLLTVEDDLYNAVIIPSYASLNVKLFAVSGHDKITLEGSITLNRTAEDDWSEEYKTVRAAENNNWNADVNYVIFPYAITATVSVLLFSKDDDFDTFEEIGLLDDGELEGHDKEDVTDYEKNDCTDIIKFYGVVTAVASGTVSGNDVSKTLLFRKRIEDCVQVRSGRFINLSRSVVAVPAYSPLQIEASFSDADTESTIAYGKVEFRPTESRVYKKDITGCNGRIRVQVVWRNAYNQLYRYDDLWDPVVSNSGSDQDDQLTMQKVMSESDQQVVSKHPSSPTLTDDGKMPEYCSSEYCSSETYIPNCILANPKHAEPLLELYSVVVCSKDGKPFKFYGTVDVTSGFYEENLLDIDKSDPLDCPKSGISVILRGPIAESFSILDRPLGIAVDIKDADSEDVISCGLISTWTHNMDAIANRCICSLARGEKGFAAVNYSIYPQAVSASVDIKLSSKFLPGVIKGKIYARYGDYEDMLFTNFIFFNDGKGVLLDDPKSSVPLLKPFLSLPVYSFLIIEADLWISPVNGNSAQGIKPLKGNVTFFKNEGCSQQIGKGDFYLDVSVKFCEWW